VELNKSQILQENKNKSGIYMWTNLLNGKSYIGSSKNITKRICKYFYLNSKIKESMIIYQAIWKYKLCNFSF